jgi:hypothetical protein
LGTSLLRTTSMYVHRNWYNSQLPRPNPISIQKSRVRPAVLITLGRQDKAANNKRKHWIMSLVAVSAKPRFGMRNEAALWARTRPRIAYAHTLDRLDIDLQF